jgi:predicted branched-subunit amino acid permease
MSVSLSQKFDSSIKWFEKCIMAFGVTDEIFALISTQKGKVNRYYIYGLMFSCIAAWTCGGFFGAFASSAMPDFISSALGIAIYGMFMAIIIPPSRDDKGVFVTVLIASVLSCAFYYVPYLNRLSQGFAIIICAFVAAGVMAYIAPRQVED